GWTAAAHAWSSPLLKSTVARPPLPKDVSRVPSALYRAALKSLYWVEPFTWPAVRSLVSGRTFTSVINWKPDPKLLMAAPPEPNVGSSRPPDGVIRSSSPSTRGRNAGRCGARRGRVRVRLMRAASGRSQWEMRMVNLHCRCGLRYNGDDIPW